MGAAGFSACSKKEDLAGRPGRPQAVVVKTAPIQRITMQRQVDVSGTLISPDQARVSSEVAGVVREVLVELGHEVQPGEVLVRLEPRELEIALRRAESQLKQTEAQLGIDGVRTQGTAAGRADCRGPDSDRQSGRRPGPACAHPDADEPEAHRAG